MGFPGSLYWENNAHVQEQGKVVKTPTKINTKRKNRQEATREGGRQWVSGTSGAHPRWRDPAGMLGSPKPIVGARASQ